MQAPSADPKPAQMLVGQALLDRARALSNRPEDQIARSCGYVGPSGRLLKKSFYRALVEARGYSLPAGSGSRSVRSGTGTGGSGGGVRGRQAEFRTRVHGNGSLLVGHAYTRMMGLEPGQEFRIELQPESRSICLTPVHYNGDDGETDATDQGEPVATDQTAMTCDD